MLSDIWAKGFVTVGDVTYESAAYVARYVLKKWSVDELSDEDLYREMKRYDEAKKSGGYKTSPRDVALSNVRAQAYDGRLPEYVSMSRRPGIGDSWFKEFSSDVFPHGFVVLPSGKTCKPPKFYDSRFEVDNEFAFAMLKGTRLAKAAMCVDNTPARFGLS